MNKRNTRNWFLGILVVVILGAALWWWLSSGRSMAGTSGSSPEAMLNSGANEAKKEGVKLTMHVASSSITDIEAGKIKIANAVTIQNPMPVKIGANRWDYAVLINGIKVAEGARTTPFELPASGSQTLTLPMTVTVKQMDAVIDQMDQQGKDTAVYTFLNTIHTDVPIAGQRRIEYNFKEELPIVRLPKMRVGDIDINDVGLKNSGMKVTMQVTNRNSFPMRLEDGTYSMTIDGKHTMEGRMQEVVTLPAKQTVPVTMDMDMKTGRAVKMGWKMLFDSKDTRYKLRFDGTIRSESKLLKNSSMHFDEEGNLADLKKEVKKARE